MNNTKKVKASYSKIDVTINLELSENEARALMKITQYGAGPYLDWFKKHLSKYELNPLEGAVKSLFDTIRKELPQHLNMIDDVRKELQNKP